MKNVGCVSIAADGDPCGGQDAMRLYIALQGGLSLEWEEGGLTLGEGDAVLLRQGVSHRAYPQQGGRAMCLTLSGEELYTLLTPLLGGCQEIMEFLIQCHGAGKGDRLLFERRADSGDVETLLERLRRELEEQRASYETAVLGLLAQIFAVLSRDFDVHPPENGDSESERFSAILGYLNENYPTATLEGTARRFSYHPNSVSALFRRRMGRCFTAYVRDLRLERACVLLHEDALPVSEIASLCGYDHMTNFYKSFKSAYGTTPSVYRRQCSQRETRTGGGEHA